MRRKRDAALPDRLGRATAAVREQLPHALTRADQLDGLQHRVAAAEREPGFVQETTLDAFHREGDCAAGADRVDTELVAALRGAQNHVAVSDPAQRAEGEEALVLQAHAFVAERVDVLAADRARHTAGPRTRMRGRQFLWRNAFGALERPALEVARRQCAKAIERQKVRRRSELPILCRRRAERSLRQVAAQCRQLLRSGPVAAVRPADGNGLDVLAAKDGATAAPAGVPAVMRDRRVKHTPLARRSDRGNPIVGSEPGPQLVLGHRTRIATHVICRLEPNVSVIDNQHRQRPRPPDDDDGVAAALLAGDGKTAAGERVVEATGQRARADDGELGGGGKRTANERTESEDERRCGRERIGELGSGVTPGPTPDPIFQEQPRAKTAAADVLTEYGFRQWYTLRVAARHVNTQITAVISEESARLATLQRRQTE